jgi:hypothetical protein
VIAALCFRLNVAPSHLIGDVPEAYDPAMVDTLVNYGNWLGEQQEIAQRRNRNRRKR